MPQCGCTQGCNCRISEDGILGLHTELGRNFTTVDGNGSVEDPFTIHFLDQHEYRPKSALINYDNTQAATDDWRNVTDGTAVVTYQTPVPFIISIGGFQYAQANFFIIGASVTFNEGSFATSDHRSMILVAGKISGGIRVIAGQTSSAAGGDPITLSCEGFTPGRFNVVGGLSAVVQGFIVFVNATSFGTSILPVNNIKVWITQI